MTLVWGPFLWASPDLNPQTTPLETNIRRGESQDDLPIFRDPRIFSYENSLKATAGTMTGKYRAEDTQNLTTFGLGFTHYYRQGRNIEYTLDMLSDSTSILALRHHWYYNPQSRFRGYFGFGIGSVIVASELFATILNNHNLLVTGSIGVDTLWLAHHGTFAEVYLTSHWNGVLAGSRFGYSYSW